MNRKKTSYGKNLLGALLGVLAVIQLYPLVWLVFFSLKNNIDIYTGNIMGLPTKFLWSNYSKALIDSQVGLYFFNSCFVTLMTIIVSGAISAMAAYAIERMHWKLSRLAMNVFLLGLMIPIHATLLPVFLILKQLNLLNSYLAMILPYVGFALPMAVLIITNFLNGIPKEMEESAFLDGCSVWKAFLSIIFPLVVPAVATVSIFTYLSTWNELMFAITFVNKQLFRTLTVGIMSMVGQHSTEWGPIGAGLVIATAPTLIIYILLSNQVQKSLVVGAVKG